MLIDDEDLDELRIDDSDSDDESIEGSSENFYDSECFTAKNCGPSAIEQKLPPLINKNLGLSEHLAGEHLHQKTCLDHQVTLGESSKITLQQITSSVCSKIIDRTRPQSSTGMKNSNTIKMTGYNKRNRPPIKLA